MQEITAQYARGEEITAQYARVGGRLLPSIQNQTYRLTGLQPAAFSSAEPQLKYEKRSMQLQHTDDDQLLRLRVYETVMSHFR